MCEREGVCARGNGVRGRGCERERGRGRWCEGEGDCVRERGSVCGREMVCVWEGEVGEGERVQERDEEWWVDRCAES